MKEVVYDIEEFRRLVDPERRIHFDASTEFPREPHDISALVTLVLEGISKEGTVIRHEKLRHISFDEVCKYGNEPGRKNTNAYDDLNELVKKCVGEWKEKCRQEFNATPGRYEEASSDG